MNAPKISILIPIYNVKEYLPKCIDSILSQTLQDFEVLLIDDGSTDSSSALCDKYAEMDNRVKVHHRTNQGISATREYALQQAMGEFVQFVDSDDWVETTMLQTMYEAAVANDADIVGCNFDEVFTDHILSYNIQYSCKDDFLEDVIASNWGVVWKHLMCRSLFVENDIHFPEKINGGEDYCVMVKALACARNAVTVNETLYHYNRCNINSTIATPNVSKIIDQIEATCIISDYLTQKGLLSKYKLALDKRKFLAKLPLINQDAKLWKKYFPESNYMMWKLNIGKRNSLKCLFSRFLYII